METSASANTITTTILTEVSTRPKHDHDHDDHTRSDTHLLGSPGVIRGDDATLDVSRLPDAALPVGTNSVPRPRVRAGRLAAVPGLIGSGTLTPEARRPTPSKVSLKPVVPVRYADRIGADTLSRSSCCLQSAVGGLPTARPSRPFPRP